jgi:hypothetical protein
MAVFQREYDHVNDLLGRYASESHLFWYPCCDSQAYVIYIVMSSLLRELMTLSVYANSLLVTSVNARDTLHPF